MSSTVILPIVLSVVATYGMHSTLLLLFAWCIDVSRCIKSLSLQERLWKSAVVIPLVTTGTQLSWTDAKPMWEWQLGAEATTTEDASITAVRESPPESDVPVATSAFPMDTIFPAARQPVPRLLDPPSVSHDVSASQFNDVGSTAQGTSDEKRQEPNFKDASTPAAHADADRVREPAGAQAASADFEVPVATSLLQRRQQQTSVLQPSIKSVVSLQKWIAALLVAVSVCGMLRLVFHALQLRYQLKQGEILTDGRAYNVLRALCVSRQIRHAPQLLMSAHSGEPAAVGLFQPTIVLPVGLETQLDSVELRALLAHELAHLVRRDIVWMWIGHVLRHSAFWQPLNLLAVKRWRTIAEFQCDHWATGTDEAGRITLAKVLTGIAEWKSAGRMELTASAAGPPLSQRITRLLSDQIPADRWQRGWRRQVSRLMLLAAVGLMSLFGPRLVQIQSASATTQPEVVAEEPSNEEVEPEKLPASVTSGTEMSLLRDDFDSLASDLQLALELLAEHEDDEQVTLEVTAIAEKLDQLRLRIEAAETE